MLHFVLCSVFQSRALYQAVVFFFFFPIPTSQNIVCMYMVICISPLGPPPVLHAQRVPDNDKYSKTSTRP